MAGITRPVGGTPPNPNKAEVELVRKLLNTHRPAPLTQIAATGPDGPDVTAAVAEFQKRVLNMGHPDGRVDPNGRTFQALSAAPGSAAAGGVFTHPDADKVALEYTIQGDGKPVVKLTAAAEALLKSILASVGIMSAKLTSTLRTYHDQARITLTQTYVADPNKVATWYGAKVKEACETYKGDIPGFAAWWKDYDRQRGKVSSLHLSNRAMDVVPGGDRAKFAEKVQALAGKGSGVKRIIPKGVMGEPVDHVEFTFDVT